MVLLANVKRKRAEYVVLYIHCDWFSGSTSNVQNMVYFQGARKQSAHHICLKYEVKYTCLGIKRHAIQKLVIMDTTYMIKLRAKEKQYELVLHVEATIAHYGKQLFKMCCRKHDNLKVAQCASLEAGKTIYQIIIPHTEKFLTETKLKNFAAPKFPHLDN